jgi:hypothetical protein
MSTSSLQQQQVQQPEPQAAPTFEEKMTWYMRWFVLIILSTGYTASIITGIIGFSITRDPRFLICFSPALFTPVIYYLVPMDQKRYELKKLKIQANAQLKAQKRERRQQRAKPWRWLSCT